jgi:hypothetical protein
MALTLIEKNDDVRYLALSTDIAGNKITGASDIGKRIFLTDTSAWKIILPDLTLADFALPVEFAGTISLGTVSIDQTTQGDTNNVTVGISAAVADGIGNYGAVLNAPGAVNSSPVLAEVLMFNNTTWDRLRGDATNGLKTYGTVSGTAATVLGNVGWLDLAGDPHGYINFNGSPSVCNIPFAYAISMNAITGYSVFNKTGYQPASAASKRAVWNVAADYVFPTAEMTMEVVSTDNTNDKAAGTGVLTVGIYYLDDAFAEKSAFVTLDGTTPVVTVASDIYRVIEFVATTTGTSKVAAGTISLRNSTDHTTIYAQIAAGYTMDRSLVYTVPANKYLHIAEINASSGLATIDETLFVLETTYNATTDTQTTGGFMLPHSQYILQNGAIDIDPKVTIRFPPGTDLKFTVKGDAGAKCAVNIRGWLQTVGA